MSTDNTQIESAQADDDTASADLINRYRGGVALLRESLDGLSPQQLLAYPIPGKMSAQEVVCHVVDADQYLADRMKRTIATERPLLVGVESADYPVPLSYARRDIELDVALLTATRAQMAADLDRLDEDSWHRTAIHTETGMVTLRQLLLHAIRHLEGHVEAIREKRAALGIAERTSSTGDGS